MFALILYMMVGNSIELIMVSCGLGDCRKFSVFSFTFVEPWESLVGYTELHVILKAIRFSGSS